MAQQPDVVTVMSKELADISGKEVVMITVEFPPGGSDPVHRHDAHGFIYVLEGSVVMQVQSCSPCWSRTRGLRFSCR